MHAGHNTELVVPKQAVSKFIHTVSVRAAGRSVLVWRRRRWRRHARAGAAVLGAGYLIVTLQLAVTEPFLIAGNLADNAVRLVLGVAGIATAVAGKPLAA